MCLSAVTNAWSLASCSFHRVLKVADPVRHAEMAEIDDRHDAAPLEVREGQVREVPVVTPGGEPGAMDGWPVTQEADPHLFDQSEIVPPPAVMTAARHLVDAGAAVVDGRVHLRRMMSI